jgi:hypothetical protein
MEEFGMSDVTSLGSEDRGWLERRWPRKYRSDLLVTAAWSLWFVVAGVLPAEAKDILGAWRYVIGAGFAGRGVLALLVARRRRDDTLELAGDAARWHKNNSYWIIATLLAAATAKVVMESAR